MTTGGTLAGTSWPAREELISRGIGLVFVAAGATGLASAVFPAAAYGSLWMSLAVAGWALAVGTALISFHERVRPLPVVRLVLAAATATVTLGVYAGGAPTSGATFFYLWVVPYAFALLSRRDAALQALWMAGCSAAVIAVQVLQHPGIGSPGQMAGLWVITVATVAAVGTLVRGLSRSLRDVDLRFHRAFRDSHVGAAFVSLDGRWLDVNDALCRMLGRSRDELLGSSVLEITAPDDLDATVEALDTASHSSLTFEKRYLRPDGQVVWAEVWGTFIRPEAGEAYLFGQYRDITAHKHDRERLAHQASHDPLTGLYNRTRVLDRLDGALARGDAAAVIILDLDGFKIVNDSLGHTAGDAVLTAIAPRLAAATAATDTLARLGGDEFVVLCEGLSDPLEAIDRAERLGRAVSAPVQLATGSHTLSASIGIAIANDNTDAAASLLRDADAAMYRAKARGRGRIELFDRTMRVAALVRLQLERDLQTALEREQFVLDFQPIVDTVTLRPVAFEALIRWDHPDRGLLSPLTFIPLAEETGLINPIGDWALSTACTHLRRWQRDHPRYADLQVTVNVSPYQLAVRGFADRVAHILLRSRIEPGRLCVELTESTLLNGNNATSAIADLKALGVRILLDDFGTGYSSLAYLTHFPIDTLKIDKAFVTDLEAADNSAIAKAVLAIAHELKLTTVAEGVETHGQLTKLRALGCPYVQGVAISPPLPAERVPAYLDAPPSHVRLATAG